MSNRYALIENGTIQVCNVILAEEGFTKNGYYLKNIDHAVFCEIGMYFNSNDGLYYQDEGFTKIFPDTQIESS